MIFTEKYMNHRSKEAETMNKKKKLDQNTIQTAKRLLKYMTGTHKIQFIIVFYLHLYQFRSKYCSIPVPEISAG